MRNESLVKIAEFRDVIMADLTRSKLESEGIKAYIFNDKLVSINWVLSQAVGGVRVMVAKDDAERATEILARDDSELLAINEAAASEKNELNHVVCEKCGSDNVIRTSSQRRAAALSILLTIPLLFWRKRYKCRSCGHSWRIKKEKNETFPDI